MTELRPTIPLLRCCDAFSAALDSLSPQLSNHQRKTAYIGYRIAEAMNLPLETRESILLAGLLHDIGAFSLQDKLDNLMFEMVQPQIHAEMGYQLLKEAVPFDSLARIVHYHHIPWKNGDGAAENGETVPLESHILHFADRISVLLYNQSEVLSQCDSIVHDIRRFAGSWFHPDVVNAFGEAANRPAFWLDVTSSSPLDQLPLKALTSYADLDVYSLLPLAQMFSRIIDFRSWYTATHSTQVAVAAELLAQYCGFTKHEQTEMRIAGYLHDWGKLVVSPELLEKIEPLSLLERNLIHTHAYHGFQHLRDIPGLEIIHHWASQHHEKINGTGYPFRARGDELSLGSRVMAVADVFVALMEERAYRSAMDAAGALSVLEEMVELGELDRGVTAVLRQNLTEIAEACLCAAAIATMEYRKVVYGEVIPWHH